ncbi:MAG: hypothetical protein F6J93_07930 [Oscillatoria sp. SIO1A7]|nr:hypothetical protein [Oscillatoria sp. SIO1A7]
MNNTNAYLKNSLVGGCRGCRGDSIPSDNLCSYGKVIILGYCIPPDAYASLRQPRAKHSNAIDFCEESKRPIRECYRPYTLLTPENGEGIVEKTGFLVIR